jgi:isoquinoline 1-oxidoreductase beta subunit
MSETHQSGLSRRSFILGAATVGAGLTLGVYLSKSRKGVEIARPDHLAEQMAVDWDPQAFVHIGTDNTVTVYCKHTEMGQGIYTGMATIVAEELDASWEQMRVEGAPADARFYSNLFWGEQFTGSSSSLDNSYNQLRQVGAATRQMLINAASNKWGVPVAQISVSDGELRHAISDRSATFGDLTELASEQSVPESVTLKSPNEYRLIGSHVRRVDIEGKTNGTVRYTQDFTLSGMLTAVVARPPRFGATLTSFDGLDARAVDGVVDVVGIPNGVAIIATHFWAATRARDVLSIEWDESNAFALSSEDIVAEFKAIVGTGGTIARDDGAYDESLANAQQVIEAEFEFPYLAHAPLEPTNCIVQIAEGKCEIWNAAQQQTRDQADAAAILGLKPEQVEVNQLYAGGAFGRRASKDYTVEAVQVAKAANRSEPIKLIWTREDDMKAGQYRPLNFHQLRAGLDTAGTLVGWHHRIVGQSILSQEEPAWVEDGVDSTSVHGANDWLYDVPNVRVETQSPEYPVPVLWYRGTGATHTVFAVETLIDDLAALANRDPFEFRISMLGNQPRMANVLSLAADKANWNSPIGSGIGRGISICEQRGTYLAQIAEVSVQDDGTWSVERVSTVIDCGLVINPDVVRAQMEGGTGFGLSSLLGDEITFKNGYVQQSNFDTYRLLRINQMPDIDVDIVSSSEPPTGVGELAPMTVGAAVGNAIYAASGKRHRRLPIPTKI